MRKATYKKMHQEHEGMSHYADPAQLVWFDELREALSPYWSARAEHLNRKPSIISDKSERPHAA